MPEHGQKGSRQKSKNAWHTLARMVHYLTPFRLRLTLIAVFSLLSAGAGVAGTYLFRPMINNGIVPLIGIPPAAADFTPLIRLLLLMGAIYTCGILSTYLASRLMMRISNGMLNAVRRDLFHAMQDQPIPYFDKHTHGELMSRFTSDVDTFREMISQGFTSLLNSAVTVVSTFVMMLILSPILTLLIVVMLLLMMVIIRYIGTKSSTNFKRQQKAIGTANGYIEEIMEGLKVVKVFSHEKAAKAEFSVLNENLRDAATHANALANSMMPIMGNLSYVNYAFTAALGAWLVIAGHMDIGSIASFLQYTRSFSQPITQISQQFNAILSALAGAERIFEVIDAPPEEDQGYVSLVHAAVSDDGTITRSDHYTGLWGWRHPHQDGSITYTKLEGHVHFADVTFGYNAEKMVLRHVSLTAKPGEKIAFVGSTGAGKTTITNLINRFYEVPEGKIRYDGININKIKKDDLRRSLAMVLQDTHLFTGTVMENIRYGKLDATDDEVIAAAHLANADAFIRHLPKGYETPLSSDGANLSQGQCQLLAIARAAVANPPVLILDEATSSIDTRTEALIEKGMDRLMHGRTVFVIAHRLSTVRNADAIVVLENGQIIECGNHDALIVQKGKYYQLYTGQFELD